MSDGLAIATGFVAAAVRVATPLLFAATGETVTERAGIINIGIEGAMLGGALAGAIGATAGGPWVGLAAAVVVGAGVALIFALVAVGAGADQIITGTAVTLAAVGLTGAIYRQAYGETGVGLTLPTFRPLAIPGLSDIPILGGAFAQPAPTYLALLALPVVWWGLFRTRAGLALRAAGEDAEHARMQGVRVRRIQGIATVIGGALAGAGGGALVLAQVGTFAERMTAGRGFIAIAIVALGRRHPAGVLFAALVFGAATALQFLFQASGVQQYQLALMLPYVLTLVALGWRVREV